MAAGGRGYGPMRSPGNGRGENSVNKGRNPAPKPERGGFTGGIVESPSAKKVKSMKEKEFQKRESGRGKGSI